MSAITAFAPKGSTVAIAVTVAASTDVQAPAGTGAQTGTYLVTNSTSQLCFLSVGYAQGAAAANAVLPVPGTPTQTIALLGSSTQVFSFGPNAWFSTIAPAATTTVYITPGDGL